MENYFFNTADETEVKSDKYFVLIIYDITDNKRRNKIAKAMKGFGFRVQKSAFEAMLAASKYEKMLAELKKLTQEDEDSVRIYKIRGEGAVTVIGLDDSVADEEVIII
ncbi:CRISPR-associated endoribonuclease Cas2 [Synergistales bacterium]|nr:CRISPR-associated endoribonuclease Cas2 [Synergistales bacterium]GHV53352.1 CRISPR-associated endoribonuclease Cas2 [Synergistales bacterium]